MKLVRLYFDRPHAEAREQMQRLETLLEDEGFSVSCHEVEASKDIWQVSTYVPGNAAKGWKEIISKHLGKPDIQCEDITDQNWVAATLRNLSAVRAGRFVVHGSHERGIANANETAICIDAGLAFGTGHHGTTAGCLDVFDRLQRKHSFRRVADLGTGSGVLAIAAAKALRRPVIATDIDPVAINTAQENARLNGVGNLVRCATAAGTNHRLLRSYRPYDLIFANILARPLERMAKDIATLSGPNTTLVLSGLLPHQRARLLAAFRLQGFFHHGSHYRDGWLTLTLRIARVL